MLFKVVESRITSHESLNLTNHESRITDFNHV